VPREKLNFLNVAALGFLVVSLGAIAYSTNSSVQLIASQAKGRIQKTWRDIGSPGAGRHAGKLAEEAANREAALNAAAGIVRPCKTGCDASQITVDGQTAGLLGSTYSNGDVAGFYKLDNGKYYPIAESAGGPSTSDLNNLIIRNTVDTVPQEPQSGLVTGGVSSGLDQGTLTQLGRTLSGPGVAPGTVESLLNPDGTIPEIGPVEEHPGVVTLNTGDSTTIQPGRTLSGPGVAPGTIIVELNPNGTIPSNIEPVEEHPGVITLNTGGATKLGTGQTGNRIVRVQESTGITNVVGSAGTGTTAFIPNVVSIITNPNKNIFQKAVSVVSSVGVNPLFVTTTSTQPGRTLSGPGVAPGTVESLLNPDGTIPDIGPVEGHSSVTRVSSKTTNEINAVGSAGAGTTNSFIPNVVSFIVNPNQYVFQRVVSALNSLQPGGSPQSTSTTQTSKVGQRSGIARLLNPNESQSLNPQSGPVSDARSRLENIQSTRFGSGIANPHFISSSSLNPYENVPQWFWDKVFPELNLTCNTQEECVQKFSALPLADGNGVLKLTLNENYVPSGLVEMSNYGIPVATANNEITQDAAALVKKLIDDLNAEGAGVIVSYGYRSYSDQDNLRGDLGNLAALPGQSMHQAGITIDINYTRPNGAINPNKPLNNNDRITEILHQNGFVQPFPRTDPGHVVALDAIQPGLVQALIDAGINPDDEAIIKSVFLGMAQTYESQMPGATHRSEAEDQSPETSTEKIVNDHPTFNSQVDTSWQDAGIRVGGVGRVSDTACSIFLLSNLTQTDPLTVWQNIKKTTGVTKVPQDGFNTDFVLNQLEEVYNYKEVVISGDNIVAQIKKNTDSGVPVYLSSPRVKIDTGNGYITPGHHLMVIGVDDDNNLITYDSAYLDGQGRTLPLEDILDQNKWRIFASYKPGTYPTSP
jgi:LAS superfamily LD-carboxypeptidase LdcB